ncbi:MAG: hypothetical protein AAF613_01190 [Pseudomonadota bacterium]
MESYRPPYPGTFRLQATARQSDARFPLGLGTCGVHEVCEASFGDLPALTGFALSASPPRPGIIFWVGQGRSNRNHGGLLQAGLGHVRSPAPTILQTQPEKLIDALWTIEEAIRSNAVGLVIAEIEDADFTASRRLALASGRHGVPVVLLMPYTREGATAAAARWRVTPRPSAPNRFDPHAPGPARWHAVLERSRQAPHMAGRSFNLEQNDETLSLTVVPGLATHAPAPRKAGDEDRFPTGHVRQFG